jgi:nicotinate-nucleotide pyrophosphorylase (carboxylating)
MTLDTDRISRLIEIAFEEDLGSGDVTSLAVLPSGVSASGTFRLRADGVVAGLPVAADVYARISEEVLFKPLVTEGDKPGTGAEIARLTGPAAAMLAGERVALNFLQRMSGVATLTRQCVEAVRGTSCVVQDTRKTIPGWRYLDKYAVRVGGGVNHRMGLYDQVLIKDNHLRLCGAAKATEAEAVMLAVQKARGRVGTDLEIEVECETMEQVEAAVRAGADIVMLDNMDAERMRRCADRVRAARESRKADRPVTEASGGLGPADLAAVAATGVDRISLGALTHSAPALDIALDFD